MKLLFLFIFIFFSCYSFGLNYESKLYKFEAGFYMSSYDDFNGNSKDLISPYLKIRYGKLEIDGDDILYGFNWGFKLTLSIDQGGDYNFNRIGSVWSGFLYERLSRIGMFEISAMHDVENLSGGSKLLVKHKIGNKFNGFGFLMSNSLDLIDDKTVDYYFDDSKSKYNNVLFKTRATGYININNGRFFLSSWMNGIGPKFEIVSGIGVGYIYRFK